MADRDAPGDEGANPALCRCPLDLQAPKNQLSGEEGNARLITDQTGGGRGWRIIRRDPGLAVCTQGPTM